MKKLLLISCLVFFQPLAIAGGNQEFSDALGWEEKWHKITSRTTEKYLSKLEKGPLSKLSQSDKNAALAELRESLNAKLSWNVVGQDLTQGIIKHCDKKTLNTMTQIHNKQRVSNADRDAVAQKYSACAKKGFSESMKLLSQTMVNSRPDIIAVMKKYR